MRHGDLGMATGQKLDIDRDATAFEMAQPLFGDCVTGPCFTPGPLIQTAGGDLVETRSCEAHVLMRVSA